MRTAAGLLALAFAALALASLATPAHAQASASPAVTITADAANPATVSVEHATDFKFSVKNTSPGGGSPVAGSDQSDVVIRLSGVPDGWTASATPAGFQLAPGESKDVVVQVSVAAKAAEKAADVKVSADLYSPLKGLDPALGNVPGGSQKATADATFHAAVHDSVTRTVLEAVGPWIYAILLLLVAAIAVAVAISVAARRTLVRLSSDTRELPVAPGAKAAFPFTVEGLARETDTVLLQVSAVQEGWAAFLPVPELVLEPGQRQELTLVVIAPRTAVQQARQAILVTATSGKAPKGAANLEFVARVEGPEVLPTATRRSKEPERE